MNRRQQVLQSAVFGVLAVVITATIAHATPNNWTGDGDELNWSDGGNWSAGVPAAGHEVTVASGSILLADETAELASFTMTGGTLTFTNWTTRLRAATVEVSGGTLTLPPAFTEQQMSNRIWIVCHDFTLDAGITINLDGRGYAPNNGLGKGGKEDGKTGNGGGGYGGQGSSGDQHHLSAGSVYGSAVLPLDPGSGGSGTETGAGAGGGAIWIAATNNVVLKGTINARGTSGTASHGGGGSGGAILIQGRTITGDGTLRATGGGKNSLGGEGGGGRIALHVDTAAQPGIPALTVTTAGGGGRAEMGTLYLTQLDAMLTSGDFPGQWDHVNLRTPEFSQWELPMLSVSKTLGLPGLRELKVSGDMNVEAGGHLTLSSGSDPLPETFYGLFLDVRGELAVAGDGTLALRSDATNDVAPYVECGRLTVHDNGTITANNLGFGPEQGIEPGIGDRRGGAAHGGSGGTHSTSWGIGGSPYGLAHRPWHAGSGGGYADRGGSGGGALRIRSRGAARIDGTLSANGMTPYRSHGSGGAGGSILLTTARLEGTGGLLSANGGNGASSLACGGGGGRIAVLTPSLAPEMLEALGVEPMPKPLIPVNPEDWEEAEGTAILDWDHFSGTVTTLPGGGYDSGTPGTIFFGALRFGTLLKIR